MCIYIYIYIYIYKQVMKYQKFFNSDAKYLTCTQYQNSLPFMKPEGSMLFITTCHWSISNIQICVLMDILINTNNVNKKKNFNFK
jgi:hypothetical protein